MKSVERNNARLHALHTKYIAFTITMYDRNSHHNAYKLYEKVQGTNQWQETEEGMVIIIKNSI